MKTAFKKFKKLTPDFFSPILAYTTAYFLTILAPFNIYGSECSERPLFYPNSIVILPQDGREVYFEAFAAAQREIRIEICVLEDPLILQSLQQAIARGVKVRVIVDNRKYFSTPSEQVNLEQYVVKNGGKLHLSNPIFPRSFPKVILIDRSYVLISSACLDSTTFAEYRDYTYVSDSKKVIRALSNLFENDWHYSSQVGSPYLPYNPTPPNNVSNLLISPVDASSRLVSFIQNANKELDITTELLGNPTLESEIAKATERGVKVRLIAPQYVNDATTEEEIVQLTSLKKLQQASIKVHVTLPPASKMHPYMHARTAIADKKSLYLGSISFSPDSITFNREVGIILKDKEVVDKVRKQFQTDFLCNSSQF